MWMQGYHAPTKSAEEVVIAFRKWKRKVIITGKAASAARLVTRETNLATASFSGTAEQTAQRVRRMKVK